jgi:hypothetical protein
MNLGNLSYIGDRTKEPAGPQTVYRHLEGIGENGVLDPGPSQKLFNHSPDGFQWGYGGSGPAQLALAILLDVTGDPDLSVRLHQNFKRDKIASLGDRFILTESEIQEWLKPHTEDADDEC